MPGFTILCANLGNAEIKYFNDEHMNKLVSRNVERRILRRIQKLKADIVVYQESIGYLEYKGKDPQRPQIRRILGDEYSIIVDKRFQFEGIAVKTSVGQILGCKSGHYIRNKRTERQGNACDQGFATLVATVRLNDGFEFDLGAFHLHSVNVTCRVNTLRNMFLGNPPKNKPAMLQNENILIAGDFNLDPWRQDDQSERVFCEIIAHGWEGKEINYHNRLDEHGLPELTSVFPFISRTIDIVASNFAIGTLDTLGITPATQRLDGGKGCDHHALYGMLEY